MSQRNASTSAARFYLRFKGQVTGPFSQEQLKQLYHKRQIGSFHQISSDKETWNSAASLFRANASTAPSVAENGNDDTLELPREIRHGHQRRPAKNAPASQLERSRQGEEGTILSDGGGEPPVGSWRTGIYLGGLVTVVLGIGALVVFWPRDHWESANAGRIFRADMEVGQLISEKHWGKAITVSTVVLEESKKHTMSNPLVKGQLKDLEVYREQAESSLKVLGYPNMVADEKAGDTAQASGRLQEAATAFAAALAIAQKMEAEDSSVSDIRERLVQKKTRVENAIVQATRKRQAEQAAAATALAQKRAAEEANRLAAQRAAEERQRQMDVARRALAEAARQAKIVSFKQSADYAKYKQEADNIQSELDTSMIGEDSAWRGMSKQTRAATKMLGVWVEVDARLHDMNMDANVQQIIRDMDIQSVGEDSAIRALATNEEGFGKMLGVWVDVLSKEAPALKGSYMNRRLQMLRSLVGEDSAHRDEQARSEANLDILAMIVTSKGFGAGARDITSDVKLHAVGEKGAQGAAMWNVEGSMNLLLTLLSPIDHDEAASIRRSIHLSVDSDDSILRTHEGYKKGITRALHALINSL